MTVASAISRVSYAGNGSTTAFSVPYYFLENGHLQVILSISGVDTVQTITTNYTVTGAGNPFGGTVTMLVAPAAGTQLTIVRDVPATQETDYTANDPFPAESHERALDKLTMLVQENDVRIARAVRGPVTDSDAINMILPTAVNRADGILQFDTNGAVNVVSTDQFIAGLSGAIIGANYVTVSAVGNGSTTAFTVSPAPGAKGNIQIYLDGVYQNKATFSLSGTTVTFTQAPPLNSQIEFVIGDSLSSTSGDATGIDFTQQGTGAQTRTVAQKLYDTVSVKDFGATGDGVTDDTSAFIAAWAAADPQAVFVPAGTYLITGALTGNFFSFGGVTISSGTVTISTDIDASGNFDAKVTPGGEDAQINLSEAVLTVATSNRAAVRYNTATSVAISCPRHILMGGFRFFGQYTKARVPVFSRAAGGQQTVSVSTDLGAESAAHLNGWYAVFACANDGDAAPTFKLMPCLRAGSVSGSSITLCSAAEGIHSNTATTYAWTATNNLNGVECLVINETVDGRANAFSGRVTTISANTTTTVTLATIGTVGAFDWLLPAPPGFDHYCYQGMFYYETPGDVRNIGDSGQLVKAKMINTADPNWSATGQVGSIASPVAIRFGGYISPLATGVVVKDTASFSTSATGTYAAYFDIDGSQHIVQTAFSTKEAAATETQLMDGITIPFCFSQEFYYSNDGSLIAQRSGGTLEITGWIEP